MLLLQRKLVRIKVIAILMCMTFHNSSADSLVQLSDQASGGETTGGWVVAIDKRVFTQTLDKVIYEKNGNTIGRSKIANTILLRTGDSFYAFSHLSLDGELKIDEVVFASGDLNLVIRTRNSQLFEEDRDLAPPGELVIKASISLKDLVIKEFHLFM